MPPPFKSGLSPCFVLFLSFFSGLHAIRILTHAQHHPPLSPDVFQAAKAKAVGQSTASAARFSPPARVASQTALEKKAKELWLNRGSLAVSFSTIFPTNKNLGGEAKKPTTFTKDVESWSWGIHELLLFFGGLGFEFLQLDLLNGKTFSYPSVWVQHVSTSILPEGLVLVKGVHHYKAMTGKHIYCNL